MIDTNPIEDQHEAFEIFTMTMIDQRIIDIGRSDPRYMYEAYEFVLDALNYTQKMLGRMPRSLSFLSGESPEHHVSGQELVDGCVRMARDEFGLMAKTVFRMWGIYKTDDIGEIVFNMIEVGLLSKTDNDSRIDFHNLFDMERALSEGLTISMDENAWSKRGSR